MNESFIIVGANGLCRCIWMQRRERNKTTGRFAQLTLPIEAIIETYLAGTSENALAKQMYYQLSFLEQRLIDLFKTANINPVPQYAIDVYNLDFAFPDMKIAIE